MLPNDYQGCQAAEGVAAMSFAEGDTSDASFISLTGGDKVPDANGELWLQDIKNVCNDHGAVDASHVDFSIGMD